MQQRLRSKHGPTIRIEADHSRLKHRLQPMHGLHTDRTAQIIIAGLAFLKNLRRGHYELGVDTVQPLQEGGN
jgi:transposase-like protein